METIEAQKRQTGAGNYVKALRRSGWVPAVLYGKEVANLPIQVRGKDLDQSLRHDTTNKPLLLQINGQDYNVMIYELQRHPVMGNVLHVDFKQINMKERVHTSVPIVIEGKTEYGVPSLVRHSLEIACLPGDIPESFPVQVEGLQVGDVILVKDLDIPANIDVGLDEMEVIVSVLAPKAASEESVEAEEEAEEQTEETEQTGAGA
ncbi:50S ribosomal protein L25 [Brevibacillus humidisoli]|uniref:50S ribosomal protein L25 n=1 Tax=Brevibacillus humidisoli TaxID=2895522 RepID=UPI001E2D012B|nr:50S ribosomal protein L25 [Brevibacillus humidisoli]UFJ40538.1 50S ribosomal protein L25 [Brevibacillus humidisoli]